MNFRKRTLVLLSACLVSSAISLEQNHKSFIETHLKNKHVADPQQITVHMIAHSHQDAGWRQTVDSYYSDFVGQVLDSVVQYLH